MKVLFNSHAPASLTHGGLQIQIEQTWKALTEAGVDVEPIRWWDAKQSGDILHHFNRIPPNLLTFAHSKGMKVVMTDLLTGQGSRPPWTIRLQGVRNDLARVIAPSAVSSHFWWDSYLRADACVVLTPWEAWIMQTLFKTPTSRVHVVPNGVESVFLDSQPAPRGPWLVCTATITERKRVLELAEAAVAAGTQLWVIGKPYSETDPYALRFKSLVEQHRNLLRYEGALNDRAKLSRIYREARGFVLLSERESLSLSALEAAACECPLLLGDLPWARSVFGERAAYCPVTVTTAAAARVLRKFYDDAPRLQPPPKPASWPDVAIQLKRIYESILAPPSSGR